MFYLIKTQPYVKAYRQGQIKTWDGVVMEATPAFEWALGKDISTILDWCQQRQMVMELSINGPRLKTLSPHRTKAILEGGQRCLFHNTPTAPKKAQARSIITKIPPQS